MRVLATRGSVCGRRTKPWEACPLERLPDETRFGEMPVAEHGADDRRLPELRTDAGERALGRLEIAARLFGEQTQLLLGGADAFDPHGEVEHSGWECGGVDPQVDQLEDLFRVEGGGGRLDGLGDGLVDCLLGWSRGVRCSGLVRWSGLDR